MREVRKITAVKRIRTNHKKKKMDPLISFSNSEGRREKGESGGNRSVHKRK